MVLLKALRVPEHQANAGLPDVCGKFWQWRFFDVDIFHNSGQGQTLVAVRMQIVKPSIPGSRWSASQHSDPLHSSPFKSYKKMQIHCIIVAWYATLPSLFCMLNDFSYVMNHISERSISWSILSRDCFIHFTGYLWNSSNVHSDVNTIILFFFSRSLILWLIKVSYLNYEIFENVSVK